MSVRFWVTLVAMAVLMLMDAAEQIGMSRFTDAAGTVTYNTDILTLTLSIIQGGCYMFWARFCLFAVPFGCCFYDEYSKKNSKYRITRGGCTVYCMAKVAACTVVTAAIVILSNLLMCLILACSGLPFLRPDTISEFTGESTNVMYYAHALVSGGHPVLFYLLVLFYAALPGIFFSVMTIMLSVFIHNKFILIAMPLTLFYSIDSFLALWFNQQSIPEWLNWRELFFAITRDGAGTELWCTAKTTAYTAVGVAVFALIFLYNVREVSENE